MSQPPTTTATPIGIATPTSVWRSYEYSTTSPSYQPHPLLTQQRHSLERHPLVTPHLTNPITTPPTAATPPLTPTPTLTSVWRNYEYSTTSHSYQPHPLLTQQRHSLVSPTLSTPPSLTPPPPPPPPPLLTPTIISVWRNFEYSITSGGAT